MQRLTLCLGPYSFALRIGILVLLITLASGQIVYAQDGDDVWTIFTNSNAVQALAVDPTTGDVWAATTGGVVRWDPNTGTYTRYTVSDGLADNDVQAIAIDADGNKWFGTTQLTRLSADGAWTTYSPSTSGIGGEYVNAMAIDTFHNKWFAFSSSTVSRLSADNSTWTNFDVGGGQLHSPVYSIAAAPDGSVWFGTVGEGASRRSPNGAWTNYTTADGLAGADVRAIAVDSANNVWFYTQLGLSHRRADGVWVQYGTDNGLYDGVITGLFADDQGNVWIGHYGALSHFRNGVAEVPILLPQDLRGNPVDEIKVDQAGNLWLGTGYYQGLARYTTNGVWSRHTTADKLLYPFVAHVAIDAQNNKWFATPLGINQLTANGRWQSYTTHDGLVQSEVRKTVFDADGNGWFATNGGVSRRTPTGQWATYTTASGLIDNQVRDLYIDANNNKWFATNQGVSQLASDGIWHTYTMTDGLAANCVSAITGDAQGNIWFGTNGEFCGGGVNRLDSNGLWHTYTMTDGLASHRVEVLAVEPDGTLWVGFTDGGASKRSPNGDWTTHATPTHSTIGAIAVDAQGNVWFSTFAYGLLKRAPDGAFTSYTTKNGLASNRVSAIAFDANGEPWFATFGGVTSVTSQQPGNTCDSALPLQPGMELSGQLANAGEVDLYRIEITEPFSRIEVTVPDPADELGLYLYRSCSTIGGARHSGDGATIGGARHSGEQRLAYDITAQTGTYYLEVFVKPGTHSYPIDYRLRLGLTPSAADSTHTLILTHEPRLQTFFNGADLAAWHNKLETLAAHPEVGGTIVWNIQTDTNSAVQQAYSAWLNDADNRPATANALALALRDRIWQRQQQLPDLRYIVLAGDDRVIPQMRLAINAPSGDDGWVTEPKYLGTLDGGITLNSSVGAALNLDQTLTDDLYGAPTVQTWAGGELPVPELAVGRLLESPAEMVALIDAFLASNGTLTVNKSFVAGYDFMQDGAELGDNYLADAGLGVGQRTRLIGPTWNVNQFRTQLFESRHDLIFVAAHAAHDRHLTPNNGLIDAEDVRSAPANLAGAVAFTLACHAGLNVPGAGHTLALDFPEAWAGKGVTFVGSTGWAYGIPRALAYQEVLMADLMQALVNGGGATVGDALVQAKRAYYLDHALNHFHAKTLAGTALYGLPMYRVRVPGSNNLAPVNAAQATAIAQVTSMEAVQVAANLFQKRVSYPLPSGSLQLVTTDQGNYYTFSGLRPHAEANEPIQPKLLDIIGEVNADGALLAPRGVLFRSATYHDIADFTPLIETANLPGAPERDPQAPTFNATGWYPSLPVRLQWLPRTEGAGALLFGSNPGQLLLYAGQYHQGQRRERLFDEITVDQYFSAATDQAAPSIESVVLEETNGSTLLRVKASDPAGILTVVATYTEDTGTWRSTDLTFESATSEWRAQVPATAQQIVQVVDQAGNVAVQEVQSGRGSTLLFLPLVAQ